MSSAFKENTQVKLYACAVVVHKAVPTTFGWTQELRNFATSCTYPLDTPVEQIREEVSHAVRDELKLESSWQIAVALCEIPREVICVAYEHTIL